MLVSHGGSSLQAAKAGLVYELQYCACFFYRK